MSRNYLGAAMAFCAPFLRASSNLRMITSHFVVLHMCLEFALRSSENKVSPAARSTASTVATKILSKNRGIVEEDGPGMTKPSRGASSLMTAFGRTKAPKESSKISGVAGEVGLDARTTLAKCVGTETFGGEPITSCV